MGFIRLTRFPTNPDVIVVGAGAAGLSAAQSLIQAGLETVVLEAADHIGGRCVTDTNTFPMPFDRGGSWLHAAPINPLAKLASASGRMIYKTPWKWKWVHALGHDLTAQEVAAYHTYQSDMWRAISDAGAGHIDCANKAAMPDGPFASTAAHSIAQMLGGDADVTSANDTFNYAEAPGDWIVQGGFGALLADLHDDVPVHLNCPVTHIDYAGPGVRVDTAKGTLAAQYLVVTVSTGVMAAEQITYNPPLPMAKLDAIDMVPNGLLNKVGILFDPVWTDATEGQMAEYHSSDDAFCSLLFGFYGGPLATGFLAGRFADAVEAEGTGAATDYCLQGLRAIFGNDVTKHVQQTTETAWRGNLNTVGSYSYALPGGAGSRQVLAEPLADRVFFAGEATMTDSYSTVHGAYLSGKRAAAQVFAGDTGAMGST